MLQHKFFHTHQNALFLLLFLLCLNITAWILAFIFFAHSPALIASAMLAYGFGLRHAVDADHIAAIDNVTRKLMQQGQTPIGVGAFFSLGHSSIVIMACAAIAATSLAFSTQIGWLHNYGNILGTLISSLFLIGMAFFNCLIFAGIYKNLKRIQKGEIFAKDDLVKMETMHATGIMNKIYSFSFQFITQSWQIYFIGFLFGLGFDTATEIGLLGISASGTNSGLSVWSIMIFPFLFTSGMALIDSLDNFIMIGAYGWALNNPTRKLYYNMTITGVSAFIALIIGSLEALGLIMDQFSLKGGFWDVIDALNENMGSVGYTLIVLFILLWLGSALYYRFKNNNKMKIRTILKEH